MGRGQQPGVMGTSEARAKLPKLVREVSSREAPADSLLEHAIEIKTRGQQRSALLIAAVDAEAMEARVNQLEEDLENAGIALYVQERLDRSDGRRIDASTFLNGIGMGEFIEELPERA